MKHLIKHLVANNFEEILSKSLLHCHCKGLHSVMLLESPGKTIRLYISVEGSDMYKNFPENLVQKNLSLAFHPHHCNLTLHCIKGRFMNWEVKESDRGLELDKYLYKSKIKDGEMAFEKVGVSHLETLAYRYVHENQSIHMKAADLHSVACFSDELSAWLVYEGAGNPDYIPYCWSSRDLNNVDSTGLYVKPTAKEIIDLLTLIGLYE